MKDAVLDRQTKDAMYETSDFYPLFKKKVNSCLCVAKDIFTTSESVPSSIDAAAAAPVLPIVLSTERDSNNCDSYIVCEI